MLMRNFAGSDGRAVVRVGQSFEAMNLLHRSPIASC